MTLSVLVKYSLAATLFLLTAPLCLTAQETLPKDSATIFINATDTVYTKVDTVAGYPGGLKAWAKFLNKNLRYPQEAQDNEIMGQTRISFIVDVDGTVSDITPVAGDPILSTESARIIQLSGKWVPAIYEGKPIKSYRIQPIVYKLETVGERRKKKGRD